MRSEGLTELTGDIVLNCTGGVEVPSGGTAPTVNLQVFLNTAVTSRLLGSNNVSESLLMIDEPAQGATTVCASGSTAANCNVYQGRVVGGNSVLFLGVPVLPPGTTGVRVYRITNVRANANAVAPGGSGTPGQVIGLISATPAQFGTTGGTTGTVISPSFPINNPQQIIGFVQRGLTFTASDVTNLQQCVSRTSQSTLLATLTFEENFATAFKVRTTQTPPTTDFETALPVNAQATPGFVYNTESGYYNPLIGASAVGAPPVCPTPGSLCAGLADFSTRVRAVFSGVPAGVRLFVSARETGGTHMARLVQFESGAFFPMAASSGRAEVAVVNGTGTAVWEVMTSDPLSAGNVQFGVYATFTADTANNLPAAPSLATVAGSFAPVSTVTSASATAPVPRFADTSTARNLFRISQCVTNLLFPFVTNQAGVDTGLAIANTSQDPFGTPAQAGTCTLNAYGANAPAAITGPSVAAGTVYTALASSAMPNFQGYVIAVCRFQFAHGFAFVSDLGARNLAMGYLALVIPDNVARAAAVPLSGSTTGEQLGQ
jgi:hypothetical protein